MVGSDLIAVWLDAGRGIVIQGPALSRFTYGVGVIYAADF
jgi:hypothetical protein